MLTMSLRLLISSSLFLSYIILCTTTTEAAATVTTTSTTYRFTNETDKRTLLAIKDQIHSDPLKVFSSWNDSLHFCSWQGVNCSRRHQRVTALRLPSLKLAGTVSPHIGNLTFLKELNLQTNTFYGLIPQEIGRLYRLQYLTFENNSFEGEFPINLTRCSALEFISLGGNNLRGKIPVGLSSLPKLKFLALFSNQFTKTIPLSLGNLTALRKLSLGYNHLDGSIPSVLGRLRNLEVLQLSVNNLSGMLPYSFYNSSSIAYLAVAHNQVSGSLPPDFGLAVPRLETFYIGKNQFSGPIPKSLANASRLARIDISQNAFTGPVPLSLGSLENLQLLSIFTNPLGTEKQNDLSFLSSLTNSSNLQILSLSQCNFGGMLPSSIANLSTSLQWLDLGKNYISGSIPLGIGSLFNLELLSLAANMLTGSIPDSMGKLTKLQRLYLTKNNIPGKIPASIGNNTLLSILTLAENMLEGSIPVSLGSCKFLQQLDLSKNYLSGEIPKEVAGFSTHSLSILYLRQNYLIGPLPSQVGSLKNIMALDVSDNRLSGEIPSSLGDCVLLEFLIMAGNSFEGQIPSSFKQLRGFQFLDLSRNNLTGLIPRFLGEFSFFWNLNLSFNKFEGEVPNEGVFSNISEFSVSGNDKLCGGIKQLGLPTCPLEVSKKQTKRVAHRVILVASAIVCIVLLSACVFAILYWVRRSRKETSSPSPLGSQYPILSYTNIFRATNGFSLANLIGEGSCGSVYKGILDTNEQIVAVKVLHLNEKGAKKSFMVECNALRNVRHRNLVKIITACVSIDFKGNDFKALVFEFMPRGSLETWLHPSSTELQESKSLNFIQRLNIAIDVAEALYYLHHHCETPLVHCDLKPTNVLLDNDLTAHVGDFGLARFLVAVAGKCSHTQSSSIGIRGTVGYVAPEYGMGGEVSTEGDVYSCGILILEMFTGKRPTDSMFNDNLNLRNFVNMALPNQVMQISDSQLTLEEEGESSSRGPSSRTNIHRVQECLISILRLGVICSAESPRERMDIRDVLMELHVIKKVFLGGSGRENNS